MTRDEAPREIEAATQENRPAQLEGADLEGADLEGVRLIQANLKGANLRGTHGIIRLPCSDPRGFSAYAVLFDAGWRIHAGCHGFGSLADARTHWGPDYDGDRGTGDGWLAALDWLEIRLGEIPVQRER